MYSSLAEGVAAAHTLRRIPRGLPLRSVVVDEAIAACAASRDWGQLEDVLVERMGEVSARYGWLDGALDFTMSAVVTAAHAECLRLVTLLERLIGSGHAELPRLTAAVVRAASKHSSVHPTLWHALGDT